MRNSFARRAGLLVLTAGIAAAGAFGQTARADRSDRAGRSDKDSGFCSSNNNWSSDDRVSTSELREMTVAATGSLNVDGGTNGGIGIRGEDRGDILVRACVQAWGQNDAAAKASAGSIRISSGSTIKAEGPEDKNWSVSYQILVPRNTNLNLSAHNGGISINGVNGTSEFETMNGGVSLANVSGAVKGRTTNGGVNVTLAGSSWNGTGLDVTTTNGGVHVTMPQNYAAHVETGTVNGGFSSDIPGLTVEKTDTDRGFGRRASKVSADINGGGAPIRIVTTNGGVKISSDR